MDYGNGGLSASDVALIQDRNNGGFGGFGDNGAWWIILFLIFAMGGWNNGGFGGGFGGGADNMYPWLSNGQKEIMQNTNQGFNTLQLGNQLNDISSGVQNISTQLCNGFAGVNQTVSSGFANAESSANARQMANMNQNFANQTAMLQGFNQLGSQFADCCCENRLATCQTQNIIQNEGNATRFADANNTRDIIDSQNRNSQAILDKLCQLELDGVKAQVEAKNDRIADLQRQLSTADFRASQTAQNAFISQGFSNEVDQLYNRLNSCPIPATPVYGRTPIFTCNNNGCGCNGFNTFA
jgi:hypothetical protein